MASYLLEFRFAGYPNRYIREQHEYLKRHVGLFSHPKYRFVPHITIVAPISTVFESRLIKKIERVLYKHSPQLQEPGHLIRSGKYTTFTTLENHQVLAIDILPPKIVEKIRRELEEDINGMWFTKCITYEKNVWHTTITICKNRSVADHHQFGKLWAYAQHHPPQELRFILDRVTLLKNMRILKEFDLLNEKTLSRDEALDNNLRYASYQKVKKILDAKGERF